MRFLQCAEQLGRRQKLISADFKVSRGLARACKDDIKLYHCRRDVSDDKDTRLAQILLCLEGAMHNGVLNINLLIAQFLIVLL
jgi:golgi apparatus protein 1